MKASAILLSAFALMFVTIKGSSASELDWEDHYGKAEKAYAHHNLFVARREFLLALKEAKECHKHGELAQKLEDLANSYQAKDNGMLAQPLLKLAQKVKTQVL